VAEWLKAHAWKVCLRETVTRVRIPLSPPDYLIKYLILQRFLARSFDILSPFSGFVPLWEEIIETIYPAMNAAKRKEASGLDCLSPCPKAALTYMSAELFHAYVQELVTIKLRRLKEIRWERRVIGAMSKEPTSIECPREPGRGL
jgi:hypothetical protein